MARVLVLRPEPGASETVKRARERGLDVVAVPLFAVEPIAWDPPDAGSFDGLLLTSANAVRHGGEQLPELRRLKTYAVGEATADAAREAGFDIAATGDSGVDRLLASTDSSLKLLHLCGEHRREPERPGQKITRIVVYRSREIGHPGMPELAGTVALIHSPRAGRRFAGLVRQPASVAIVAISKAAAEAAGEGWRSVETADQPNDDSLLALAARLCNNSPPE